MIIGTWHQNISCMEGLMKKPMCTRLGWYCWSSLLADNQLIPHGLKAKKTLSSGYVTYGVAALQLPQNVIKPSYESIIKCHPVDPRDINCFI